MYLEGTYLQKINLKLTAISEFENSDNKSTCHFLHVKTVGKVGQKGDFAKFHSNPKHRVLNIYKNGLGELKRHFELYLALI